LGGGFIDYPQLKPHGFDAQPILLGDGVVDDGADPLTVHEAVNDFDRAGDITQPPISPLAQRVLTTGVDWDDAHAEPIAQIATDAVCGPFGVGG